MKNSRQFINLTAIIKDVCFSPKGDCTSTIVNYLNNAKINIYVQAYSFTSDPISKALVEAYNKKVDVKVILDKGQKDFKYSEGHYLIQNSVPVQIDTAHSISHNKIIIIDNELVITGSFNFTKNAQENNSENLVIIQSKELANIYIENWKHHSEHSINYNNSKEFINSQKESIFSIIINKIKRYF